MPYLKEMKESCQKKASLTVEDTDCIVLFSGDIIRIKKIYRLLDARMLERINIICYDFQEDFLQEVFSPWSDRVVFNSYSIEDVREVFNI